MLTELALTLWFDLAVQVTPLISELGRTRMQVNVKVKAGFGSKDFALNVVITIPGPDTTAKAEIQTDIGGSSLAQSIQICRLASPFELHGIVGL